jgi:hypothetical protein
VPIYPSFGKRSTKGDLRLAQPTLGTFRTEPPWADAKCLPNEVDYGLMISSFRRAGENGFQQIFMIFLDVTSLIPLSVQSSILSREYKSE